MRCACFFFHLSSLRSGCFFFHLSSGRSGCFLFHLNFNQLLRPREQRKEFDQSPNQSGWKLDEFLWDGMRNTDGWDLLDIYDHISVSSPVFGDLVLFDRSGAVSESCRLFSVCSRPFSQARPWELLGSDGPHGPVICVSNRALEGSGCSLREPRRMRSNEQQSFTSLCSS